MGGEASLCCSKNLEISNSVVNNVEWRKILNFDEAKLFYSKENIISRDCPAIEVELRVLLDDPIGFHYLNDYCASLASRTVCDCWMAIIEFKKIGVGPFRIQAAKNLYAKYVSKDFSQILRIENFDPNQCTNVEKMLDSEIFDSEIFHWLQLLCFSRLVEIFKKFKFSYYNVEMIADVRKKYNRARARDFDYISVIGSGSFGVVVHCVKKSTGIHYAMKIVSKYKAYTTCEETPWRVGAEKDAFASCKHPFIVELAYAFHTSTLAIMVMSLGHSDLKQVLIDYPKGLGYSIVRFYAAELVSVLSYLHNKGLIYRDLKPGNILLNDDGHIMLTDFGTVADINGKTLGLFTDMGAASPFVTKLPNFLNGGGLHEEESISMYARDKKHIASQTKVPMNISTTNFPVHEDAVKPDGNEANDEHINNSAYEIAVEMGIDMEPSENRASSFVGTQVYMAPEIITTYCGGGGCEPFCPEPFDISASQRGTGYSYAVDWWSLGITLYKLYTGSHPFPIEEFRKYVTRYMYGRGEIDPIVKLYHSIDYSILNKHVDLQDIIVNLLKVDEKQRLGSRNNLNGSELENHALFQGINWDKLIAKEIPPPFVSSESAGSSTLCDGGDVVAADVFSCVCNGVSSQVAMGAPDGQDSSIHHSERYQTLKSIFNFKKLQGAFMKQNFESLGAVLKHVNRLDWLNKDDEDQLRHINSYFYTWNYSSPAAQILERKCIDDSVLENEYKTTVGQQSVASHGTASSSYYRSGSKSNTSSRSRSLSRNIRQVAPV